MKKDIEEIKEAVLHTTLAALCTPSVSEKMYDPQFKLVLPDGKRTDNTTPERTELKEKRKVRKLKKQQKRNAESQGRANSRKNWKGK